MQPAVVIALIGCLLSSSAPASARANLAAAVTSPALLGGQSASVPAVRTKEWSRVVTVTPGQEILVIVQGAPPVRRYFVRADETALTVLNLAAPGVTPGAARAVRRAVSRHPDYFAEVAPSGELQDGNVRLSRAGIFVADQKVAELSQILEQVPRADAVVVEKRTLGPMAQAAIGAAIVIIGTLVVGCRLTGAICGG